VIVIPDTRTAWRVLICSGACALFLASLPATQVRPAAQSSDAPCDVRTTERVVAIGDIHGAYDRFVAILRAAGLTDTRDRWIGKKTVLVQTGDVVDRGPDSKKAIDLIRKLERDAQRDGGRVYALVGNHEFARLVDDWRYVSAGEYEAFKTADSMELRERALAVLGAEAEKRAKAADKPWDADAYRQQFLKEVPLGFLEMRQAFGPMGEYGKWVRARPAVVRVNGIVFLHGGVSATVAPLGCDGINAAIQKDLAAAPVPLEQSTTMLAGSETGPLWYRGLANEPEEKLAPVIDTLLMQMRARAFVVGHTTTPGTIVSRLGGRVIQIDSGMVAGQFYPGGAPSALELQGNKATAIYLDRREPLDLPALSAAPAAASK
jgi:hypothetical protein